MKVAQVSDCAGARDIYLRSEGAARPFCALYPTGGSEMFLYRICDRATGAWETGAGHLARADLLVRDRVIDSSARGAHVCFGAGVKDVVNLL